MRVSRSLGVAGGLILIACVGCSSDDGGAADPATSSPAATDSADAGGAEPEASSNSGPKTQLTWSVTDAQASDTLNDDELARAADILVGRLESAGFEDVEPAADENAVRIVVAGEVPGDVATEIGRPPQLTFHPVLGAGGDAEEQSAGADGLAIDDESGEPLIIGPAAIESGDVAEASADLDSQTGAWSISISFTEGGGDAWTDLTAEAACQSQGDPRQRIAIVLDEEVISSPAVAGVECDVGLTGSETVITGDFSEDEATDLANQLSAARLLVELDLGEHAVTQ